MTDTYLGANGQHVVIPARETLADYDINLNPFRAKIRASILAGKNSRYYWLRYACEQAIGQVNLGDLARRPQAVKTAEIDAANRMLAAILIAEKQFDDTVDALTDDLLNCFSSPNAMRQFNVTISHVVGCNFSNFGGLQAADVKRQFPWLPAVLKNLSPARFTAMFQTLRIHSLLDGYRSFPTQSLKQYLNADFGDVRHLESDEPRPHGRVNIRAPFRARPETEPHASDPYFIRIGDSYHDLRENDGLIKTHMGLDVPIADVVTLFPNKNPFHDQLESNIEMNEVAYRGQLLECFLRDPKNSSLNKAPDQTVWPYVAENFPIIDRILFQDTHSKAAYGALQAINRLPIVPRRYIDSITQVASDGRTWEQKLAKTLLDRCSLA